MIYKYLPVCLLLALFSNTSKANAVPDTIAENNSGVLNLTAPAYYGSKRNGGGVHFSYGVNLGYAHTKTQAGSITAKGGGFLYGGDLGVKISLPCRNQNATKFLSVSVQGIVFPINDKYKDVNGNEQKAEHKFSIVSLPISLTKMGGGEGAGFYWQLGVNPDYMYEVKNKDVKVTSHYSNIVIEPFAGFGLAVPFVLVNRSRSEVGGGKALIGVVAGYYANNMAKDSGATMHGYNIAFRWCYIFM